MKIGDLKQRSGVCQIGAYCSTGLSGESICSNRALEKIEEQDFMDKAKATREKMKNEYRAHMAEKWNKEVF